MTQTTETNTVADQDRLRYQDRLRGGDKWSWRLKRGQQLRLTDIEGGGNFSLLAYNYDDKLERYNMPDSLKAQHTFYLTTGYSMFSDMGRVLLSFVDDQCGWHDTITGVSNAQSVREKFGDKTYQNHRNQWHQNGHNNLIVELGKHGLGERDLAATVNLFTKIKPEADSSIHYITEHSKAGSTVTLRADMNTLVVGAAIQHPMDPTEDYAPKPIGIEILSGAPADDQDPCRLHSDESKRAFTLTDHYFLD